MKKLLTLLLAVTCVCGCSQTKNPTNESKTARIPMVMVDGELYMDTGYDSTIEGPVSYTHLTLPTILLV